MKNLITIGLPSKGRLKDKSVEFFNKNGLKILSSEGDRNYFASIDNKPNIKRLNSYAPWVSIYTITSYVKFYCNYFLHKELNSFQCSFFDTSK